MKDIFIARIRNIFRVSIFIFCLSILVSCAYWEAGQDLGRERAAVIADEAFQVVMWKLCNATSIGSLRRNLGHSAEKMAAYHTLCQGYTVNLLEPAG